MSCPDLATERNPVVAGNSLTQSSLRDVEQMQQRKLDSECFGAPTSPIHRLPVELLVQLFRFYFTTGHSSQPQRTSPSPNQHIVVLSSVCAHWRDIICTTPCFWRRITVCNGHEWLDLALSRCAGMPADVVLRGVSTSGGEIFTSVLPRYAHILRSIHATELHPSARTLLVQFLRGSVLPLLRSLSVTVGPRYRTIELNAESLPKLRKLTLLGCVVIAQPALYRHLRVLSLTGGCWSISIGNFLDILEDMSRLQYLRLRWCELPLFSHHAPPPSRQRPVALPHLSTLQFVGLRLSPSTIACLLSYLRLKSRINIELEGDAEGGQNHAGLLAGLLPDEPWTAIPSMQVVTSVAIHARLPDAYYLRASGGSRRRIALTLSFLHVQNIPESWNDTFRSDFHSLCALFSPAPVTRLYLEIGPGYLADADWARFFQRFPLLRHLVVSGPGSHSTLWNGLREASIAAAAAGSPPCAPQLSSVETLTGCSNTRLYSSAYFLEAVRTALRVRAEQGLRLGHLRLGLFHTGAQEHEEQERSFRETLRSLVTSLEYVSTSARSTSETDNHLEARPHSNVS